MTREKDMEPYMSTMDPNILELGSTTHEMERASTQSQMAQNMMDNILMEKSTEEALILSQMGLDTMAHSNMGRDTEEARLRNRVVRSMKECGKKMKNMVKADSLSLMGQDMWENS